MKIVKYGLDRVDVGCDDSPMFIGLEMEFCGDTVSWDETKVKIQLNDKTALYLDLTVFK